MIEHAVVIAGGRSDRADVGDHLVRTANWVTHFERMNRIELLISDR